MSAMDGLGRISVRTTWSSASRASGMRSVGNRMCRTSYGSKSRCDVAPVLSGLRVIAVEQYGAGPYGSMQLADLGAEVIKIENPADGGDMARHVGPFFFGDGDRSDDSQFFHSFNRNKKSVTLDLKKPQAHRVLHALAARAAALFDTALQNLAYLATWYLNAGHLQGREPRSGHPSLVPSQLYRTGDGFIFIMCNKEKFWPVLCERLGRPEWAADPRFRSFKDRLANRDEINRLLDEALSARPTAEWLQHFAGRVPAAPVNDLKAALDNPFVAERDGIRDYDHVRMVAGPVRDGAAEPPSHAAPALGADTDAVLRDCGFSDSDIAALRADKVI